MVIIKSEIEKEAAYFMACILMPKRLVEKKNEQFVREYPLQTSLSRYARKNKQRLEYLFDFFQVSKGSGIPLGRTENN